MEVAFLTDQIPQPDHLTTVINPVMTQVLEYFAPFKLGFIGNIRQFLPDTLFDDPHKNAVSLLIKTFFITDRELFKVASDGPGEFFYLGSR
ncbi:hypothetical protein D3C81_1860280 [compost metagenome]